MRRMRVLGFVGPYQEGKHPYMLKSNISITIPNRYEGSISVDLLIRILRQAGIPRSIWLKYK